MPTPGRRLIAVDGRIEMEDTEFPDPGPGQVLVRVTKSLVSAGSEQGALIRATSERRPLGYTTVGRVIEAGAGMEAFRQGDRAFTFGFHGTHWVSDREDHPDDPIHIQRITREVTDEQAALSRRCTVCGGRSSRSTRGPRCLERESWASWQWRSAGSRAPTRS